MLAASTRPQQHDLRLLSQSLGDRPGAGDRWHLDLSPTQAVSLPAISSGSLVTVWPPRKRRSEVVGGELVLLGSDRLNPHRSPASIRSPRSSLRRETPHQPGEEAGTEGVPRLRSGSASRTSRGRTDTRATSPVPGLDLAPSLPRGGDGHRPDPGSRRPTSPSSAPERGLVLVGEQVRGAVDQMSDVLTSHPGELLRGLQRTGCHARHSSVCRSIASGSLGPTSTRSRPPNRLATGSISMLRASAIAPDRTGDLVVAESVVHTNLAVWATSGHLDEGRVHSVALEPGAVVGEIPADRCQQHRPDLERAGRRAMFAPTPPRLTLQVVDRNDGLMVELVRNERVGELSGEGHPGGRSRPSPLYRMRMAANPAMHGDAARRRTSGRSHHRRRSRWRSGLSMVKPCFSMVSTESMWRRPGRHAHPVGDDGLRQKSLLVTVQLAVVEEELMAGPEHPPGCTRHPQAGRRDPPARAGTSPSPSGLGQKHAVHGRAALALRGFGADDAVGAHEYSSWLGLLFRTIR